MSYFNDHIGISGFFKINGVAMPDPTDFIIDNNNMSSGGTLADGVTHEGTIEGVKNVITWNYALLTKEHYLMLYNATQKKYNDGTDDMYFIIEVPFSPAEGGILTIKGYFQSKSTYHVWDSTAKYGNDIEYWYGGEKYDELLKDTVFSFIQK